MGILRNIGPKVGEQSSPSSPVLAPQNDARAGASEIERRSGQKLNQIGLDPELRANINNMLEVPTLSAHF